MTENNFDTVSTRQQWLTTLIGDGLTFVYSIPQDSIARQRALLSLMQAHHAYGILDITEVDGTQTLDHQKVWSALTSGLAQQEGASIAKRVFESLHGAYAGLEGRISSPTQNVRIELELVEGNGEDPDIIKLANETLRLGTEYLSKKHGASFVETDQKDLIIITKDVL